MMMISGFGERENRPILNIKLVYITSYFSLITYSSSLLEPKFIEQTTYYSKEEEEFSQIKKNENFFRRIFCFPFDFFLPYEVH